MSDKTVVRKLGRYGAAFDLPGTLRAYTYHDQPDNVGASRLGGALRNVNFSVDSIDHGLSLLKALQDAGFGVYELEKQPC